jgi:hypothetical protein
MAVLIDRATRVIAFNAFARKHSVDFNGGKAAFACHP